MSCGHGTSSERPLRPGSDQQVANDPAVDVGEPEVAALVMMRESLVIEPHLVQQRRLQVVDVHRVLDHVVPQLVRATVDHTGLDAAPAIHIVKQRG